MRPIVARISVSVSWPASKPGSHVRQARRAGEGVESNRQVGRLVGNGPGRQVTLYPRGFSEVPWRRQVAGSRLDRRLLVSRRVIDWWPTGSTGRRLGVRACPEDCPPGTPASPKIAPFL